MVSIFATALASILDPLLIVFTMPFIFLTSKLTQRAAIFVFVLVSSCVVAYSTASIRFHFNTTINPDPLHPFDPEYKPWPEVYGTKYEQYIMNFAKVRDAEGTVELKQKLDRHFADCIILTGSPYSESACFQNSVFGRFISSFAFMTGVLSIVFRWRKRRSNRKREHSIDQGGA